MKHQSLRLFRVLCIVGLAFTVEMFAEPGINRTIAQAEIPLRVAMSTSEQPVSLGGIYGLVHYGHDFGVDISTDNITYFQSHTLAVQAVLSGQADIVGGVFAPLLLLRQAGQDFKAFCLRTAKNDATLIGRGGVTKIEQLLDPKVRVSVDSTGGNADTALNAMFQAEHINATTSSLPNLHILESSGQRAAAIIANQVDATVINLAVYAQVKKAVPDAVIISEIAEDAPLFIAGTYAAPKAWIDSHLDEATDFCAAVIKGQRALQGDFDLYTEANKEFIKPVPSADTTRQIWNLVVKNDAWGVKSGLDPEAAKFMSDVLVKSGALKAPIDPADVLDLRAYQGALKLLGPYVAPTEQATPADGGSTPQATSAATPNS